MVRPAAGQDGRLGTHQAAGYAAVEAERHEVAHAVGGPAWADVGEAGQQHGTNQVVISDDRGAVRKSCGDSPKLATVKQLSVGEMDVGHGERAEIDQLCHSVHQRSRWQWQDSWPAG